MDVRKVVKFPCGKKKYRNPHAKKRRAEKRREAGRKREEQNSLRVKTRRVVLSDDE